MLGGMLGLPTGAWGAPAAGGARRLPADWEEAGSVDHVFTHFALNLSLLCAERAGAGSSGGSGLWWPVAAAGEAGPARHCSPGPPQRGLEWRRGSRSVGADAA